MKRVPARLRAHGARAARNVVASVRNEPSATDVSWEALVPPEVEAVPNAPTPALVADKSSTRLGIGGAHLVDISVPKGGGRAPALSS